MTGRVLDIDGRDITDFVTIITVGTYSESGRVTGYRTQALAYVREALAAGERLVVGDPGYDVETGESARWVDTSSGRPELRPRPVLETRLSSPRVAVDGEVVAPALPPCTVRVSGPVSTSIDHAGGDLSLSFSVPGDYRLEIEAFPHLPLVLSLGVVG